MSSRGRSGIGLLGFAVLAIVVITLVAAVAFVVGQQVALARESLGIAP